MRLLHTVFRTTAQFLHERWRFNRIYADCSEWIFWFGIDSRKSSEPFWLFDKRRGRAAPQPYCGWIAVFRAYAYYVFFENMPWGGCYVTFFMAQRHFRVYLSELRWSALIYFQIPQALPKDHPASGRPHKPKPLRAPNCISYSHCLDVCSFFDWKEIPCRGCTGRQDVPIYDMPENDMIGYFLLAIAVCRPDAWRGSLLYRLRNLSFDVSQELEILEVGEF